MIWGRASHFADGKNLANPKDQHFPVVAFQQFKLCGKQSWYVMAGFYCKVQILKNNPPLTLGFLDIWAPSIVLHCFALFSNAFEIFLKGFLWVPIRFSCWTWGMVVNFEAAMVLLFCRVLALILQGPQDWYTPRVFMLQQGCAQQCKLCGTYSQWVLLQNGDLWNLYEFVASDQVFPLKNVHQVAFHGGFLQFLTRSCQILLESIRIYQIFLVNLGDQGQLQTGQGNYMGQGFPFCRWQKSSQSQRLAFSSRGLSAI